MKNYRISSYVKNEQQKECLRLLKTANEEIDVVCGDFSSEFYNSEKFVEYITSFLSIKDTNLSMIFNGNVDNPNRALERLKAHNKNLFADIKGTNFCLYWIPIMARRHYTLIDNLTAIIESEHGIGEFPEDLYFFVDNPEITEDWKNAFERMKNSPKTVNLSKLI